MINNWILDSWDWYISIWNWHFRSSFRFEHPANCHHCRGTRFYNRAAISKGHQEQEAAAASNRMREQIAASFPPPGLHPDEVGCHQRVFLVVAIGSRTQGGKCRAGSGGVQTDALPDSDRSCLQEEGCNVLARRASFPSRSRGARPS